MLVKQQSWEVTQGCWMSAHVTLIWPLFFSPDLLIWPHSKFFQDPRVLPSSCFPKDQCVHSWRDTVLVYVLQKIRTNQRNMYIFMMAIGLWQLVLEAKKPHNMLSTQTSKARGVTQSDSEGLRTRACCVCSGAQRPKVQEL